MGVRSAGRGLSRRSRRRATRRSRSSGGGGGEGTLLPSAPQLESDGELTASFDPFHLLQPLPLFGRCAVEKAPPECKQMGLFWRATWHSRSK